jgi:hypothetical protein
MGAPAFQTIAQKQPQLRAIFAFSPSFFCYDIFQIVVLILVHDQGANMIAPD